MCHSCTIMFREISSHIFRALTTEYSKGLDSYCKNIISQNQTVRDLINLGITILPDHFSGWHPSPHPNTAHIGVSYCHMILVEILVIAMTWL
ncbi:hypothetical protein XELAEV_18032131mg [Xenopus laevis]|uniref:Uncharacterized protein n=1 Tax=Xenopus laevis TaxID=8355 RepID=A0A974CPG2_XENLA|nr:hypothetical protein XELAEV_18032131mg [Xenopus laevis]